MAVLRPDQAQLTFASEAAPGADQDIISGDSVANPTTITTQANPGDLSMTLGSTANLAAGDFLIIGGGPGNDDSYPSNTAVKPIAHKEIRRIEHIAGATVHFDRPLGFTHHVNDANTSSVIDNAVARVATLDLAANSINKVITFVPGVYETVDTPDPQMSLEPRYFLGTTAKRNFNTIYAGQQIYQGALSGIVLLNGWPLRFPIGKEIPKPKASAITGSLTLAVESFLGDVWVKTQTSHGLGAGQFVVVGYTVSPDLTSIQEIRQIKKIIANNQWVELETPLAYAHAAGVALRRYDNTATGAYVEHNIVERTDLDSISMHIHMRDSGETALNDFDRRYVGGKVGAISITAEEGGLVSVNWDSVIFKDMLHNQPMHSATTRYVPLGSNTAEGSNVSPVMPGYAIMNDIVAADILFPTTQPYYFSGGTLRLLGYAGGTGHGEEFARVRNFSISINNNEDPRYYITARYGSHRGPSEIREQRREYTMSCTVALPDTKASSDNTLDNATVIFKELLLEGRYDTTSMKGFNISLKFVRGTFSGGEEDALYIDIPGPNISAVNFQLPGQPSIPTSTLGNQGAFLRSAPHTITTEAPFQVACDFAFRNMALLVRDNEPVYP